VSSTSPEREGHLAATTGGHVGVFAGAAPGPAPSAEAGIRRFEIGHALRSIEDALILLDGGAPEGLEIAALQRIRDDLAEVLRHVKAELPG
jgi:hypothetical protein